MWNTPSWWRSASSAWPGWWERERVTAGTGCGFGTLVGRETVAPSIAWHKLRSLAESAELATQQLWAG